jgi:hypothetical protein
MPMPDWRGAILSGAAVLAACSPSSEEETSPSPGTQAVAEPVEEAGEHAGTETTGEPGTTLPPSDATFRYVGRWAESAEQCRSEAWTLTRDGLTAPDDVACDFTGIEKSPGGYAIDAMCAIDGEEEDDNITLRFAESAKAMLIEGAASLPETGLIYCGDAR